MKSVEALVRAWEEGHWEFTLAFERLADKDLWARPHPNLLSIGELAGHVAYNESVMAPPGTIVGLLVDKRFDYYLNQIGNVVTLDLTVAQVLEELKRVREAAKPILMGIADLDEKVPWRDDWTWGVCLRYRVFHVAYHCGQAYSVRHLLGHVPTDN